VAALTWSEIGAAAVNDFELVVPGAHPPVAAALDALRGAGAHPALLSGSGGACFGAFSDRGHARAAATELGAQLGWVAVPVRTLSALPGPELL